jgi:hypothetical protein
MVEVEHWGKAGREAREVDEGGLLWLVGQLFAKTTTHSARIPPKGRIAVSGQNLASNFDFFFEGHV